MLISGIPVQIADGESILTKQVLCMSVVLSFVLPAVDGLLRLVPIARNLKFVTYLKRLTYCPHHSHRLALQSKKIHIKDTYNTAKTYFKIC